MAHKAPRTVTRRTMLTSTAGLVGTAVLGESLVSMSPEEQATQAAQAPQAATTPLTTPAIPPDPTKVIGAPTRAVGQRASFETLVRTPTGEVTGNSLTPLHQLAGTITPADLHFERHHAGVPQIDPTTYTLIVHGLVEQPLVFTLDDLKRFPSVTRTHFIECSGNGRSAYRTPKPEMTAQAVDGLTSNSEWTGVLVSTIFREVGVRPSATWFLAEGNDASVMARSIPVSKGMDDAIIAYAQNGEALRPEQGYPVRLVLPGWEGNTCVKWLRRLELGDRPWMTRWETSKYTDPLPNDTARMFSFEMDAKSIITAPSYPAQLTRGYCEIRGLAWTGRGKIAAVDVSTDGGHTWAAAELQAPVLSKAHTRFRFPWQWDGREALIMSRAKDETGYVQPMPDIFHHVRGGGTDFHFNPVRAWRITQEGHVFFHVPAV